MNGSNEYKYSGNFWINGNTHLATPMHGNNKRELFRRLRVAAERELAKGYRLYIQVINNKTAEEYFRNYTKF